MYIAKFALITLVTFALLTGCAMIGKEAEMAEETDMAAGEKPIRKNSRKTYVSGSDFSGGGHDMRLVSRHSAVRTK